MEQQARERVSAQTFIEALWRLEDARDAEPMAALYADGASVSNPLVAMRHEGPDGARRFWTAYRAAFETIRSDFSHVLEAGGAAILEWTSRGEGLEGPFEYRGVSVLEYGDDGITAFRTYFDPRRLGQQLAEHPAAPSR